MYNTHAKSTEYIYGHPIPAHVLIVDNPWRLVHNVEG
jgi:hypothetical protein